MVIILTLKDLKVRIIPRIESEEGKNIVAGVSEVPLVARQ